MDKTTEFYYKQGKVPEWIYNQLNGKTAQENYSNYQVEQQKKILQQQVDEKELENHLCELLENNLVKILKGFQN